MTKVSPIRVSFPAVGRSGDATAFLMLKRGNNCRRSVGGQETPFRSDSAISSYVFRDSFCAANPADVISEQRSILFGDLPKSLRPEIIVEGLVSRFRVRLHASTEQLLMLGDCLLDLLDRTFPLHFFLEGDGRWPLSR